MIETVIPVGNDLPSPPDDLKVVVDSFLDIQRSPMYLMVEWEARVVVSENVGRQEMRDSDSVTRFTAHMEEMTVTCKWDTHLKHLMIPDFIIYSNFFMFLDGASDFPLFGILYTPLDQLKGVSIQVYRKKTTNLDTSVYTRCGAFCENYYFRAITLAPLCESLELIFFCYWLKVFVNSVFPVYL